VTALKIALLSHINGDSDLVEAWLRFYRRWGVSSFHLIVHGRRQENRALYSLMDSYPIIIEDAYEGPFHSEEKKERLNSLLARMRGQWVLLVDSDEFVEFPFHTIGTTVRMLQLARRNALFAPMLQHLTPHGRLDTPEIIEDPFRTLPLCSLGLYERMGVRACGRKFPLFFCTDRTTLRDGGNHGCPVGNQAASLQGVTHHFKFRRSVSERLDRRIHSSHPWRQESVQFQNYLAHNANRLPTEGAFLYSRDELFRRGLLRGFTLQAVLRRLRRTTMHIWGRTDAAMP
jgi:Glycosyl transferase family 2